MQITFEQCAVIEETSAVLDGLALLVGDHDRTLCEGTVATLQLILGERLQAIRQHAASIDLGDLESFVRLPDQSFAAVDLVARLKRLHVGLQAQVEAAYASLRKVA